MRILTPFRTLSAAAAFALFVGCSSGAAIAPTPASPQASLRILNGQVPGVLNEIGSLNITTQANRVVGHYSCPLTGPIVYVSDQLDNAINIFAGKFAGQAPCGQLTSGLRVPNGLYVEPVTHDLYVANLRDSNILVFHRNQTSPYNTYVDPNGEAPGDVTVAKDGTVIAINANQAINPQQGSISTWLKGPSGGTFVGNFLFKTGDFGNFITLQRHGKLFYDVDDQNTGQFSLWFLRCPLGNCGTQTHVARNSSNPLNGLASDASDDLIVATGGQANLIETFELPNPIPSTFSVTGIPVGIALNTTDKHLFIVAFMRGGDGAEEYTYPGGLLVGTVKSFAPYGIAVDPGHAP
jgi:hypothetical protein